MNLNLKTLPRQTVGPDGPRPAKAKANQFAAGRLSGVGKWGDSGTWQ